jgi:hypothetical protein
MYGLIVCLPIRLLVETGMLLLALELALIDRLEGLSAVGTEWLNELMLRSLCRGTPSSRRPKKVALDAVIGVPGVLLPICGGGVSSSESEAGPKALTRAIVGVLSGSKFSGGNRMGARSFFLKLEAEALFSNIWNAPPPNPIPPNVIPRFLRVSRSVVTAGFGDPPVSGATYIGSKFSRSNISGSSRGSGCPSISGARLDFRGVNTVL